MSYATQTQIKGVCFSHIKPLDSRIVEFAVTARLPVEKLKYSHSDLEMFADLVLTGTKQHSKEEIDSYIKLHGIKIAITHSVSSITYTTSVIDTKLKAAVSLIKELLENTTFDKAEFAIKQKTLLEENREAHDDARKIAEIQFRQSLYPKNVPERYPTLLEERQQIEKLTLSTLRSLKQDLTNGTWFVSLVGNDVAYDELKHLLNFINQNARVYEYKPQTRVVQERRSIYTTVKGKTNVEIRIGNILPILPSDDDFIPFMFGLAVLGKVGGFSGRLMSTVREKEGLTYGIYATTANFDVRHFGHWYIYTFFTAHDLEKGLRATIREITTLLKSGITEEELTTFKDILRNIQIIGHGSNASRLALYHNTALFGNTPEDIDLELKRIERLTVSEVNTALRRYIQPKALVISGAGPVTKNGIGIQK